MKVEGRNAVYELLKTDKEIDKILVQKDLKDDASKRLINVIRSHKVKLQPVDKYVIEKESESKRHQGFIAYVSDYEYFELEELIKDSLVKSYEDQIEQLSKIDETINNSTSNILDSLSKTLDK